MTRQLFTLVTISFLGVAVAAPVPKGPSEWVTVKGRVVWPETQPIPERKDLAVPRMADREYVLKGGPLLDDQLLVHEKTRGVKNVVVWLRPDSDDPRATIAADKIHPDLAKPEAKTHAIGMEFCRYSARILAVRAGDKLKATNHGAVAENFNLQGTTEAMNVLLNPDGKAVETKPLTAQNPWVTFQCNIHPWMVGRARVFDHPYFAVTDENGDFEVKLAPKGKWRIVYQHELGYHQGYEGRLGLPLNIQDEGKGAMRLKTLDYDAPTRLR